MEVSEGRKRIEKKERRIWNKAERVSASKEGTKLTSSSPSAILEASLCLKLYQCVLKASREFVTQAEALSSVSRTHRATQAGWLALYPLGGEMGGRGRWIHGTHCLASLAFLVKFHANERPMKKPKKGQGSSITSAFTYLHIHAHSCTYIFSDIQHYISTKLPSLKI